MSTDCAVPQSIPGSDSYSCSFVAPFTGGPGSQRDIVTAVGDAANGAPFLRLASARVFITDILPDISVSKTASPDSILEPGGPVTFTVDVTNNTDEAVDLTGLVDDVHGDLNGQGDCVADGSVSIAANSMASCSFTVQLTGNAGETQTDYVFATVADDDGNQDIASAWETVAFDNVDPTFELTKTPRPASVAEPGGTVRFRVRLTNTSPEPIRLQSLVDTVDDDDDLPEDLDGQGSCRTSQTIDPGETYVCSFTRAVSGDADDEVTDTITALVTDDDGNSEDAPTAQAIVPITATPPTLSVVKVATPPTVAEPGGDVIYTTTITNTSVSTDPVDVLSLTDTIADGDSFVPDDLACEDADGLAVSAPFPLLPGAQVTCTFAGTISGDAGNSTTDVFRASGIDDEGAEANGQGARTVLVTDVQPTFVLTKVADPNPIPEPGGTVEYTVSVQNTSAESITLTSLSDDVEGPLDGIGDCAVPQTIDAGDTYACSWESILTGDVGDLRSNIASATIEDNEGNEVIESVREDVEFSDVLPDVSAFKTAAPVVLPEPGGNVTFTYAVRNNGPEDVTLDSFSDSVYGSLAGQGTCSMPQTLTRNGGFYACTYVGAVTGSALGSPYPNTLTATVSDNEDNSTSATAEAAVILTNVDPVISVTKTPSPLILAEPGGTFSFNVVVTNESDFEAVTLNSLTDDLHGDITVVGGDVLNTSCSTGGSIAPLDAYSCTFSVGFSGVRGDTETDTVTASASDDEGNSATADAEATIEIADPVLTLVKSSTTTEVTTPGQVVPYSYLVTNTGNVTISDLTVSDDNVDADPVCLATTLAPGGSTTCSASHTVTQAELDSNGSPDAASGLLTNEASATGTPDLGELVPPTDDLDIPIVQDPELTLVKTGTFNDGNTNGEADPGETISYAFSITNSGNVTLTDVSLADTVGGVTLSGGPTIATLAVGATDTTTFTGSYTITQADIDAGEFLNTATATGTDSNDEPVSDPDDETVALPQAPALTLVKTGTFNDESGDGFADAGETISYAFSIANSGNVTLTDVTLADTVGGVTISGGPTIASLAVGATDTTTFTGSYTLTQADVDAGDFLNTATATGTDSNGDDVSDPDDETVTLPGDIDIVKTGAFDAGVDGFADPGELISYTLTVTNPGVLSMTNVVVSDPLPGLSAIIFTGGDTNGNDQLDIDETWTYEASYAVNQADIDAGEVSNTASVTGTDTSGEPATATDPHTESLPQNPVVTLVKTGTFNDESGDGFADAGETIDYAFSVTNDGNVTLTSVTLADTIGGVTLSGGPIATLAVDQVDATTFSGSYTITQLDVDAGTFTNTATVTGTDSNDDDVSDSDSDTQPLAQDSSIALVKTGTLNDDDGTPGVSAGDTIDYAFSVTNDGNVTLTERDPRRHHRRGHPQRWSHRHARGGPGRCHHLQRQLHHHPARCRRGHLHQHRHRHRHRFQRRRCQRSRQRHPAAGPGLLHRAGQDGHAQR